MVGISVDLLKWFISFWDKNFAPKQATKVSGDAIISKTISNQ